MPRCKKIFRLFCVIALIQFAPQISQATGGDLDTTFNAGVSNGFGSSANVVVVQTDGRVLVGGAFTVAGGRSRQYLVRFNADGTVDQSFNVGTGANDVVKAIVVQTDGKILIGGNFFTYNGASVNFLARLNADGSLDTSFNTGGAGPAGQIFAIALQTDGKIIIGGSFGSYNGTSANNLTRLNTNGSLDTTFNTNLGTGFNSFPLAVSVESGGKILVGGSFSNVNGTAAGYVARLNSNGTVDAAFMTNAGTGFDNFVYSFAIQTDGKILAGGGFSNFNGTSRNALARLNSTGTLDTGFTPIVSNQTVLSIVIQTDGRIIAAGQNLSFGAMSERVYIARLNQSDGSLDLTFDAGTGPNNGIIYQTALQLDGTIFAVGNFTAFSGITRSGIVKLNTSGSVNTAFSAVLGLPAAVNDILVLPDNKILIGGNFRGVNECYCDGIAKLNADGTTDTTFNPGSGTNGFAVNALAVQTDNKILVGGGFVDFGGGTNDAITRLNADGSLDAGFNVSANGYVTSIAIQTDGKILIGGSFNFVNGNAAGNIARLNTDGSLDMIFNTGTGFDFQVDDVVFLTGGQILVGGAFTEYNGTTGVGHIARLNSNGTIDTGFTTNTGTGFDLFSVYELAVQTDGKIIAGGSFVNFNGSSRSGIARLNSNGTLDGTFSVGTGFNGYVNDLTLQADGRILAVGSFTSYNGVTRNMLARLNTDGSLDASFDSGAFSFNTLLNAVALQTDGRILIGGTLSLYDNTPRSGIARLLAGDTIIWTGAANTDWNNAANWSTNFVPTSVDNAVIGSNFTVNLSSGNPGILTLTIGTNSTLTIASGASLTIEGGTNDGTIAGAGTLNFIGTALGNNGTISITNVNANFGTSGNKALTGIGAFVGNTLTIAPSVILALQNNHQFNSINIQGFGTFDATSRTVSLRGTNALQGSGTYINTFGTTIFDGTVAQNSSLLVNFNNLTINNAAGVTFNTNSTVENLTLSNGNLSMGSNTLFITNTITRTSGHVIGTMSKNMTAGNNFTFTVGTANGYSPVTVTITSGSIAVSAQAFQTNHPSLNASTSLNRYWTLSATGSSFTASLTLNYLQTDVFGNESDYRITRIGGSTNVYQNNCPSNPCVNTSSNSAFINGVSQFSDWTLSSLAPTSARAGVYGRATFNQSFPLAGANINLINTESNQSISTKTDENGLFNFEDVPTGQTYIITAQRFGFNFSNSSISFDHTGERDDLLLDASPSRLSFAHVKNDFDGDGKTDIVLFRPSTGEWHLWLSLTDSHRVIKWGVEDDLTVPADFDGDGKTDMAVYRRSEGNWYILQSFDKQIRVEKFGLNKDIPTPADFDGDGKADLAVFRPSDSIWYFIHSSDKSFHTKQFGLSDDIPIVGNFDNDNKADIAVYRKSEHNWYIFESVNQTMRVFQFGLSDDVPTASDYDGDGLTDISVFRPTEGVWYSHHSSTNEAKVIQFGLNEDVPTEGDYDGDGKTDVAVYREGVWFILKSLNNHVHIQHFGSPKDRTVK